VPAGLYQQPAGALPVGGPFATRPYGYVTPKNPGLSLLASFFVPGLGSIINGDVARGIGIMIGYLVSWLLVILVVGLFGVFGFWVWGLVDAYQGARTWNARHGIVS
jgi:TM2 domain-containing membrane protein YozV